MCIGRIYQYHCGCFSAAPKIFRCELATKRQKCDSIGPLITANILSFCDVCMERRKNNTIELKRIIDESRKIAEAKAEAKAEAIRAAERKAAIDAIDINIAPLIPSMAGLNTADGGGGEKSGVEAAKKTGVGYHVGEVAFDEHGNLVVKSSSSKIRKFAKAFHGCFKKT